MKKRRCNWDQRGRSATSAEDSDATHQNVQAKVLEKRAAARAKAKATKAAKVREKASEAKALEKIATDRLAKEKVRDPWKDAGHVVVRTLLGSVLRTYSNKVERKVERRDRCDISVD